MQLPSIQSETTLSQRRGKIARLPRAIREQLNCRLDDGLEASEILPWLNDLPEVRQIVIQRFNGVPISPQNLSAWRQGGFQEWLLQRELFDSASHMCEHVQELQEIIGSDSPDDVPHTLADYMVTQLSVRFAAFLGRWDGNPSNEQIGQLLKSGNWLHFQCVETQWVEEERAAVDTKMDTTLTVTPALFQNAVTVTSQAANATDSHFITIKGYEALSPNPSRKSQLLLLFRHPNQKTGESGNQ